MKTIYQLFRAPFMFFSFISVIILSSCATSCFTIRNQPALIIGERRGRHCNTADCRFAPLYSAEPPENVNTLERDEETDQSNSVVPKVVVEEEKPYPVDLPSPILLALSVVLAISSIGSIFELFGGSPQLGVAGTASVALLGTPLCIFLFYASVLKGNAETEEDDKKFLKDRY